MLVAIGAFSCACYPSFVFDLRDSDAGVALTFSHRMKLSFTGADIAAPLDNFPILVKLDSSRFDYSLTRDHGEDVRFLDTDEHSSLPYEIERWDESGTSLVWVRVPSLSPHAGEADYIWMYFGNANAPDGQSGDLVWSEYESVYHLADDHVASDLVRDSAGGRHGHNHASEGPMDPTVSLSAKNVAEGHLGLGLKLANLAGEGSRVDTDAAALTPEPSSGRTVEAWFKRRAMDSSGAFFATEACCLGWRLGVLSDGANAAGSFGSVQCCNETMDGGSSAGVYTLIAKGLPNNKDDLDWHQVVVRLDRVGGMMTVFLDGVGKQDVMDRTAQLGETPATIGYFATSTSFPGSIDELRVGRTAFSDDWVRMQYKSTCEGVSGCEPLVSYGAIVTAQ
jgi:hypothetical protein